MDIGKLPPAEVEASIKERYREAVETTQIYELRTMLSNVIFMAIRDMAYELHGFELPQGFENRADRKADQALDEMLRTCPPEAWGKMSAPVMSKEAAMREREYLLSTLANIEACKLPSYILELMEDATRRVTGVTPPTTPAPQPSEDKQP